MSKHSWLYRDSRSITINEGGSFKPYWPVVGLCRKPWGIYVAVWAYGCYRRLAIGPRFRCRNHP